MHVLSSWHWNVALQTVRTQKGDKWEEARGTRLGLRVSWRPCMVSQVMITNLFLSYFTLESHSNPVRYSISLVEKRKQSDLSEVTWLSDNLKPDVLVPNMRCLPQHEGRISPEAGTSLFAPTSLPTCIDFDGMQAAVMVTLGARSQDSEAELLFQENPGLGTVRSPF